MAEQPKRPGIVDDEHLEFLDDLRESGEADMLRAEVYLQDEFCLKSTEAGAILAYWMRSLRTRRQHD